MSMSLSHDVTMGLKQLGKSTISDETFVKMLNDAISVILNKKLTTNPISPRIQSDGGKESYAALLSLLLEAARGNVKPEAVSSLLKTDCHFSHVRCDKLVAVYEANTYQIQAALLNASSHLPHVVDANWDVQFCTKASAVENSEPEIEFLVQLHTQSPAPQLIVETDERVIRFHCNRQELQDLVLKLKEAVKQVELVAHTI